jgi:hypothetical protein
MEQLLHRGVEISELAYLRVLQMVHMQTSSLVDDLKGHELPHVSPRTPYEAIEFRRSLTGAAHITGHPTTTSISAMLETAMEELFVTYTEGQRYLEREIKSLGVMYANLLSPFSRYHVSLESFKSTNIHISNLPAENIESQVVNVRPSCQPDQCF